MAWNAVLAAAPDVDALVARFGRSYMEHVAALARRRDVPERAFAPPRRSCATRRPAPPELVTLGKPDLRALEAARAILAHVRSTIG